MTHYITLELAKALKDAHLQAIDRAKRYRAPMRVWFAFSTNGWGTRRAIVYVRSIEEGAPDGYGLEDVTMHEEILPDKDYGTIFG